MSVGITKTLGVIAAVKDAAIQGVAVSKLLPVNFWNIVKFVPVVQKLVTDLQVVAQDAPDVLPELQDLDAAEVGQIGSAAYQAVVDVVKALQAA